MYEKINQIKFQDSPSGRIHYERIKGILTTTTGSALIGFSEHCNHIHPKNDYEKHGFHLMAQPGKLYFKVPMSYKKGDHFHYQYQSQMSNTKAVFNYGFYYRENPYKQYGMQINFFKSFFTKQKYEIAKELGLMSNMPNMEQFFAQDQFDNVNMEMTISTKEDYKFLTFVKLVVFNSNHISIEELKHRLSNNEILDYDSEVRAPAYMRTTMGINKNKNNNSTLSYVKINKTFIFLNILILFSFRKIQFIQKLKLPNI